MITDIALVLRSLSYGREKGVREKDDGNRRFLVYAFHARICTRVSDSCMPSGGSYAPAYLRPFAPRCDDTSRRFISRDSRSFFVRPTITKADGAARKNRPSKYILVYFFFVLAAHPPRYITNIACFSLCLQVRRATEAVQRLCQCPSSKCSKLKVRKVGEGRYHIAGRNVFIRVSTFIIIYNSFFFCKIKVTT